MLENIKIDGYAMIRPILEQEDIVESTKVLKKLVDNNKKKYLDSLQKVSNDTQKKVYAIFDDGALIYNRINKKLEIFGNVKEFSPDK